MCKDIWNVDCDIRRVYCEHIEHKFNYGITGQEDINDDARSGRPSTSTTDDNIEAVKKMIFEISSNHY